MNRKTITFIFFALVSAFSMQAQNEKDFYTETNYLGVSKNIVATFGANGTDTEDDSKNLQTAIDELTQLENGGRISIPEGTFYLADISLKSNIHIEIDANATIQTHLLMKLKFNFHSHILLIYSNLPIV